jgi:pimeloyl-ACP methyl ester carboxylesterase
MRFMQSMTRLILMGLFLIIAWKAMSHKKNIYLFPGQGSDYRIFQHFVFDTTLYRVNHIQYPVPAKKTTLTQYARLLSQQIDTARPFILIGVSLGGMICSELAEYMNPQKIIIISSAKCRSELPARYRFQKHISLYKIFPAATIKWGAQILQPVVEPDRNKNKTVFKSMLGAKNKKFLKRTVAMITGWDKKTYSGQIIHIHGTNDHTLPLRKVCANVEINKGSHMMALTRGHEIFLLVNSYLNE